MADSWVLTIGNFDGVHRGHQALLARTLGAAKKLHGRSRVCTFFPHPMAVLTPESAPPRLFDLQDQQEQFKKMGVDDVEVIPFTLEFSRLSPEKFFQDFVRREGKTRVLWVGHDFQFGKDRLGNRDLLQKLCKEEGIEFHELSPEQVEGRTISSSAIRDFLQQARLTEAERMLGRRYSLRGSVVQGARRGRSLGFPTANLQLCPEMGSRLALKNGVYACSVQLDSKAQWSGVVNVGINPTVSIDSNLKVEVHIFDFAEDLYGQDLKLELVAFLRPEMKFAGLEELKAQIAKDIESAKAALKDASWREKS
jgi:riboflavin kinase/FMN adenylyltransferase